MKDLKYRAEIDGLRPIAVLAVIFYHAKFRYFSGGFVGVDIFFVISGYLITRIIHTQLLNENFSIIQFYERRARRILPALIVVVSLCVIPALFLMIPGQLVEFGDSLIAVALFVSNILFFHRTDYLATSSDIILLIHTWSLAIEEKFYLIFPLILIVLVLHARNQTRYLLLGLLALSFGATVVTSGLPDWRDATFYLSNARACELFAGGIIAVNEQDSTFSNKCMRQILSVLGLASLGTFIVIFHDDMAYGGPLPVFPVLGTMFVIGAGTSDTLIARMLSTRLLVATGLISYSLYLYH